MLSDPEVGRWLWFAPLPLDVVEAYFGPPIDRQTKERAPGETPQTAVFAVEDLDGVFLGHGATIAVNGSANGFEIAEVHLLDGIEHGARFGYSVCIYSAANDDGFALAISLPPTIASPMFKR